ncbi:uncharacterized protein LOC135163929 [Diachasmimorpha longicaudata]|uniref:uncharacterized protein LOC135163929 n=1 Tax=Diachasmimorpha longicaudata TaxID=58733 RepID=UPI0030B8B89A
MIRTVTRIIIACTSIEAEESIYSTERIEVIAHSLGNITASLPTFSAEKLEWDHRKDLNLADPEFRIPAPIDILIGADVFSQIIKPNIIRQGSEAPAAQSTTFGWIVFGPTGSSLGPTQLAHHMAVSEASNDHLEDLLTKFSIQEEVPGRANSTLSADELSCAQHFRQTHSRDSSGRYVVQLPLSYPVSLLGNLYRPALACLHRMLGRISKDPQFFQLYSDFLKEYVDLDHMRLVDSSFSSSSSSVQMDTAGCSDEMTLPHEAQTSGGLRVSEKLPVGTSDIRRNHYLPHHGIISKNQLRKMAQ